MKGVSHTETNKRFARCTSIAGLRLWRWSLGANEEGEPQVGEARTKDIDVAKREIESIQAEIDRNTDLLGGFEKRSQIENYIAVLEGRQTELETDIEPPA